jgi:hypothetical protein
VLSARLDARVATLAAGPSFAAALRAVEEGTIDPYDAADLILADSTAE